MRSASLGPAIETKSRTESSKGDRRVEFVRLPLNDGGIFGITRNWALDVKLQKFEINALVLLIW